MSLSHPTPIIRLSDLRSQRREIRRELARVDHQIIKVSRQVSSLEKRLAVLCMAPQKAA